MLTDVNLSWRQKSTSLSVISQSELNFYSIPYWIMDKVSQTEFTQLFLHHSSQHKILSNPFTLKKIIAGYKEWKGLKFILDHLHCNMSLPILIQYFLQLKENEGEGEVYEATNISGVLKSSNITFGKSNSRQFIVQQRLIKSWDRQMKLNYALC